MFPLELPKGPGILGAMITPVVLISAGGTLVLSTSNRLGRVVDRIRKLTAEAEEIEDGKVPAGRVDDKRALIRDQLAQLLKRLHYLQTAITTLYTSIGLLVGTSLSIGLTFATHRAEEWLPTAFGLAGATALFYATTLLVRETRVAVRSTLVEIGYTSRLVDRVSKPTETTGRGAPPLA